MPFEKSTFALAKHYNNHTGKLSDLSGARFSRSVALASFKGAYSERRSVFSNIAGAETEFLLKDYRGSGVPCFQMKWKQSSFFLNVAGTGVELLFMECSGGGTGATFNRQRGILRSFANRYYHRAVEKM